MIVNGRVPSGKTASLFPANHAAMFPAATHGYRDHYESKSAYRTQYRRGFTSGYQDVMGK